MAAENGNLKDGDDASLNSSERATKVPTPAAQRALAEAAERRALEEQSRSGERASAEHGGRAGPDPVRYGDWENGGIASDF